VNGLHERVVRGIDLRAAAEKLTTSIPSFAAASNAARISGVFATWPIGVGTVKTR
jgi:hypothetical protein